VLCKDFTIYNVFYCAKILLFFITTKFFSKKIASQHNKFQKNIHFCLGKPFFMVSCVFLMLPTVGAPLCSTAQLWPFPFGALMVRMRNYI